MINKSWNKIAVWFSYAFNIFFWHSIRFPRINLSNSMKIFNVFSSWYKFLIILKYYWRKKFCFIKNLNLFFKSFVNPFVDIALSFFDTSFNSFIFDVKSFSLLWKSIFFYKLAISLWFAKFACLNLAAKSSAVNLLNSRVVIYLSSLWSVIYFSISIIFISFFN